MEAFNLLFAEGGDLKRRPLSLGMHGFHPSRHIQSTRIRMGEVS